MELHEQIATVSSSQELADFLAALRYTLTTQRHQWENPTLEDYLEAMEAWIRDHAQKNAGQP